MKIAQFINSHDGGGAESLVVRIADALTEKDIPNCVFHFGNEWLENNIKVPNFLLRKSPITKAMSFGRTFGKALKEVGVTHLHSHLYGATIRGAIAAKRAKIPHIATQHDIYTIQDKPNRIRWLKTAAMMGTRLAAVSMQMENVYRSAGFDHSFCSFDNETITTVYNGVDTNVFKPMEVERDDDIFHIVSVGRLDAVKNYPLLLRAIDGLIHKGREKIRLTIIGDGPQKEPLQSYIDKLGIHPWAKLLGQQDNIPYHLNTADLFVLPSFSEGLSCSILEAMSCGLPVLASNVGGNPEIIKTGGNGWLFESNNQLDLVEKLDELITQADSLPFHGKMARCLIEDKFSLNSMVDNYLGLYKGQIRGTL